MSLPELTNWDQTRMTLHHTLRVLLLARLVGVDPLPIGLRHSLRPTPKGVTTGKLNFGGELTFDYRAAKVTYFQDGTAIAEFDIQHYSQKTLAVALFEAIAGQGHQLEPDFTRAEDATPLILDSKMAVNYGEVQWAMFRALSHLKANFIGSQSPLVVWAHGFDLSTLWFPGGMDEHNDPHINFGFSPGTPDLGQPYVYFYVYPALEELPDHLPEIVTWHTAWSTPGGIIPYERFANVEDSESLIVNTLFDVYETVFGLLIGSV